MLKLRPVTASALVVGLFAMSCYHADPEKEMITRMVKAEYLSMRHLADSVFLADSIDQGGGHLMNFEEIKFPGKAIGVLDTILTQGTVLAITPAEILKMLQPAKIRLVTLAAFEAVRMPKEAGAKDSDRAPKGDAAPDTGMKITFEVVGNQNDLTPVPSKTDKVLMFFRPFRRYKDWLLMDMVRYHFGGINKEEYRLVDLSRK